MKRLLFTHEYRRTRGFLAGLTAFCAAIVAAATLLMATPVNPLAALAVNALLAAPAVLVAAARTAPQGTGAAEHLRAVMGAAQPPVTAGVIAAVTAGVLITTFAYLAMFYFAISIGNESRLSRLGAAGPIVTWFAAYLVMQLAAVAGIVLIPLGIGYAGDGFTVISRNWLTVILSDQQSAGMPIGFAPVHLALVLLMIWRTARSWNHEVALR